MKPLTILLFVLVFKLSSFSQDSNFGMSFNHVALSVADVDRSATFYASVLNLNEITNRTEVEGIRWMSLGEDKELHLISVVKEPVSLNKAVHFAMTANDFDGFIKGLVDKSIPYSSWAGESETITTRADGIRQVYIQDPDGYWIEINSAAK